MRKPAKKFFSPEYGCQSIMRIRQWLASGASPVDVVRWINSEYAKATDDRARFHLGMMLCAALATEDIPQGLILASKSAKMFGLSINMGQTVSECAMQKLMGEYGEDCVKWFDSFNAYFIKKCPLPSASAPADLVTRAVSLQDHRNLITIDAKHSIYAVRDVEGKVWIMAVNGCNTDVLIDEEMFDDNPPLYFTATNHFVSPIWIVSQVTRILEYILKRIGYPPFPIYKKIIFDKQGINLINEEEYIESKQWVGFDVVSFGKTGEYQFVSSTLPMVDIKPNGSESEIELCSMLYLSLMATAEILESFDIAKHPNIDEHQIEEWCKKTCIFTPDHFDFLIEEFDDD